MNGDTDEPADSRIEPEQPEAQTQISDALGALLGQDKRWSVTSRPGSVVLTRGWPDGSADTLIILSPDNVFGWREDPSGHRVWSRTGTVAQIVAEVRDLDEPLAPDTPTDPVPEFKCDWRE